MNRYRIDRQELANNPRGFIEQRSIYMNGTEQEVNDYISNNMNSEKYKYIPVQVS